MARSRNIKPSFFMNEDLAELDFGIRLLFAGLWTLADREGRLEDRPRRIKRELFPSDTLDVEDALSQLEKYDFIKRYKFEDFNVIQVVKFLDHQSPHGTEKDSELPDENGYFTVNERSPRGLITGKSTKILRTNSVCNDVLTVQEPLNNETGTVNPPSNNALIPDSGFLIPDSGFLIPDSGFLIPESNHSTFSHEEISPTIHENQPPPPITRKGQLCKQLRAIGVDAAPHKLDESNWITILEKRTDEEILGFAENLIAKSPPGKRINLAYMAPALLEDPTPVQNRPRARDSPPEDNSLVARVRRANPLPGDAPEGSFYGNIYDIGGVR